MSVDLRKSVFWPKCLKETTFCETGFPSQGTFLHEPSHHCIKCFDTLFCLFVGEEKRRIFASSSHCPYQLQHHTCDLSPPTPASRLRSEAGDLQNLENFKLALPEFTSTHFVGSEVFPPSLSHPAVVKSC